MSDKKYKGHHGHAKKENTNKRPPLTHFLCFPLVNQSSATQLASSLNEFKSKIPLISPPAASRAEASGHVVRVPLVPDDAIRPLGTLHLTLGVMSLGTRERLEEALGFLQSLDINGLLREVETEMVYTEDSGRASIIASDTPSLPLTVDLTSLKALPNTRSTTILHAHPLDTTSRLYPLGVKLRNKFIEAGFMHCEMIKAPKGTKSHGIKSAGERSEPGENFQENTLIQTECPGSQKQEGLIPRPLLLHATVANTIYVKGRRNQQSRGKRGEQYKFNSAELLAVFGDPPSHSRGDSLHQEDSQNELHDTKQPFVWANDIVIDRVCICEMGAKPVLDDPTKGGPTLGQAYIPVGEKYFLES
ncbi:hypothetical protein LOZ57_004603 [Ophidiomyces ophidiicola]|uniref:uncharacterized protein n=1 Tax=Ophidiomyces ophidiicola TaxID=1387563 RepID=UPI0020C1BA9B|nr:uncharacterized protein LOZ57_004603 [Ophidiomyces ophidiicola]KAI1944930.1 hypothetical protein LOZ57_004603 [Ophidiomyces ophidiicola]KAI2061162.1 hypothetical protein LOZ43_001368 [Ophidiomyces ophidiicola]KAI2090068.1 hypothetical protein LOZ36_001501 [Ophidiomyces ophidiicola]